MVLSSEDWDLGVATTVKMTEREHVASPSPINGEAAGQP